MKGELVYKCNSMTRIPKEIKFKSPIKADKQEKILFLGRKLK